MQLTMMKGGARVRLDYDEGWCAMYQYIMCQYIRKELTMMKGGEREGEVVKKGSDDEVVRE